MARLMDLKNQKKAGAANAAPAAPKPPLEEPAAASHAPAVPAHPQAPPSPSAAAGPQSTPAPATTPSAAPSSAPAAPQRVIDEEVLMKLPDAALVNFGHSRFNTYNLATPQDVLLAAIENQEIALIVKVAKQRNLLGALFSPSTAEPARVSVAPGPVHTGPEAYDATMASDVRAALVQEPQPVPASQPPPPPARVSKPPPTPKRKSSEPPPAQARTAGVPLSDIAEFVVKLRESPDSTKARLDQANLFIRAKVREIVGAYGKKEFDQAEETTKQKQQQAEKGVPVTYTPLEQKILDLFELNTFIAWLSKRLKAEGGVHEVLEANGKNGAGAPQPGPQPAPAQPAAQAAGPQEAPAAPAAAEGEKKPSRPSMPPPQPKPGFMRRFFTSYTTWSVAGIGAFTGALAYTDGFRDMAFGAKRLAEILSGRQVADIPTAWAVGAYSAVMATIFTVSLLIKRSMERRRAERAFKRAQRSREDREKMGYVFKRLSEIVLNYSKTEDQKSQLRQTMRTDEKLFICMYELRKDAIFDDILEDARVPQKLRGIITQVMIPGLELELMEKRLRRFADLIYEPKRLAVFEKTYDEDPVFRVICDEIFKRNLDNNYIDPARARAIFSAIENSKNEKVGEPLLRAFQEDYDIAIKKRETTGKK